MVPWLAGARLQIGLCVVLDGRGMSAAFSFGLDAVLLLGVALLCFAASTTCGLPVLVF